MGSAASAPVGAASDSSSSQAFLSSSSSPGSSSSVQGGHRHSLSSTPPAHFMPQSWNATAAATNDPLASHIARDLPRHIIERRFGSSSGRLMRSYRIRHVDSGALMVLKAMMVRIEIRGGTSSTGDTTSLTQQTKGGKTYFGTMTQQELHSQDEQLLKILVILTQQANADVHTDNNAGDHIPPTTLEHPHILPFYHWFASTYGNVITNNNNRGILPAAFSTGGSQQHTNITFGGNAVISNVTNSSSNTDSTASSLIIIEKPIYLLRPHVYSTLFDRMLSRPFLSSTEKMFIAFQILKALQALHQCTITLEEDGIQSHYPCCHGHLTCENVGLTSWNWVVLLDIAPPSNATKPICIPDDDPSDFIYYFQEQGAHPYSSHASTAASSNFPFTDLSYALAGTNAGAGGGDKRCYLAPERFYTQAKYTQEQKKNDLPNKLTPAMDIFSLGCVLVELFLNGERAFDLGDLMEYRKKNGAISDHPSLQQKLNKIESSAMRAACRHMLQLEPSKRLSAGEYLDLLTRSSVPRPLLQSTATTNTVNPPFPPCFENILLPFLRRFRCELFSPDARIAMALLYYGNIIRGILSLQDDEGEQYFRNIIGLKTIQIMETQIHPDLTKEVATTSVLDKFPSLSLRICDPFRHCQYGKDEILLAQTDQLLREIESTYFTPHNTTSHSFDKLSNTMNSTLRMDLKDACPKDNSSWSFDKFFFQKPTYVGALTIYLQFILSTFRHCQRPSSKVVALKLILRLATYCDDEDRLQRIIPSLVDTLQDVDGSVRATSITALSATLDIVRTFPPSDARIFPQYIFKRVSNLVTDPVLMVRIAFTESIGLLAETALRFLNTCHAVKVYEAVEVNKSSSDATRCCGVSGGTKESQNQSTASIMDPIQSLPNANRFIKNTYDKELSELRETVARWVVQTATDSGDLSSVVKQAMLNDVARLCDFFGQEGVMAYILPQVLAFLNDRKDWRLRASLCEHLPSICAVIGRAATEQFVVPCVETALVDEEDLVISSALNCLEALVKSGLVTRGILLGTRKSTRLSMVENASSEEKNNEDASKKTESSRAQGGIIKKYAPLLMHPCADVRLSAAALISAACRLMGFPDDEIILLPLFRPFLRHDISRFKLKAPDGILSCVMPPLSSLKDQNIENELERIKRIVRNVFGLKSERYHQECLYGIKNYHAMLPHIMKASHLVGGRVIAKDSLELLPRSVFICYIPDQRHVETVADPPPLWYTGVRQMLSSRSRLNRERSLLKSISTLGKVYGININRPAVSSSLQRRWKGDVSDDDFYLLLSSTEEAALSEVQLDLYLSSIDASLCDATLTGEWGSSALIDPAYVENTLLYISKVAALELPPLPPRLGIMFDDERRSQTIEHEVGKKYWKPKADSLIGTSIPGSDHVGPVIKLAVSKDNSYFISGGSDGRVSIWESRQLLDNDGSLTSQIYYSHVGDKSPSSLRINDINIIDNSDSVVSAGSDGSVNVWRIDCVSGRSKPVVGGGDPIGISGRVCGSSLVRKLACSEGEIVALSNFVAPSGAVITFASQRGIIHSWDLRSECEPFTLKLYPEVGLICSMTIGRDQSILTGTKKGFLALWDIRFHKIVKLWRHSSEAPITCLRTYMNETDPGPTVSMSCGHNEAALFDLISGSSRVCLRSVDPSFRCLHQSELPVELTSPPKLIDVIIPSEAKRYSHSILGCSARVPSQDAVTAILGTHSPSSLITAGTDGGIRFWDLSSAVKSFNVCGSPGRSVYERIECATGCNTIICRQPPSTDNTMIPRAHQRGPTRETGHIGAVLDLAKLESPFPVLLSCSGDGSIKAWK